MANTILPQVELGPRVGGIKELATRLSFYNGIINSLMVAALYYGENPIVPYLDVSLQSLIPSMLFFYGILLAGAVILGFIEHVFVIKAQAEYNQLQQFGESISPIRRDVHQLQTAIDELSEKLDE